MAVAGAGVGCDPDLFYLPDESLAGTGGAGADPNPSDSIRPAPAGRVARLSHAQWENSVRDLLRLDEPSGLSASFPEQARSAGYVFDNAAAALRVEQALWGAYGPAATSLAQTVTSDAARLARLLPDVAGDDAARARAFVEAFGQRAFRRPLTDDELASYLELHTLGQSSYADVSGFDAGVRLVIEAMLQSPFFLYRIESSTAIDGELVVLSDWEIAQRLSYFLTNSMPDDALFDAARAGELSTPGGLRAQIERLLDTAAARAALGHFHDQLLNLTSYTSISPSPALYPNVSSDFGRAALASTRALLDDLVFNQGDGFRELMTTNRAFVNADLAGVYGLSGDFDAALVPVQLPADERRGLFTQAGFLAANATGISPDPIHRGVFIAKRMLCRTIAAPPDNVTPLPPTGNGTNRQVVEDHTESQPGCAACHEHLINPYGFVFESYDAVGSYRTIDNGLPVDTSAAPLLDGGAVAMADALAFADALSTSRDAHECFAQHLFEYALGRSATSDDDTMITSLGRASLDGASIVELVAHLAGSAPFIRRSAEELP